MSLLTGWVILELNAAYGMGKLSEDTHTLRAFGITALWSFFTLSVGIGLETLRWTSLCITYVCVCDCDCVPKVLLLTSWCGIKKGTKAGGS